MNNSPVCLNPHCGCIEFNCVMDNEGRAKAWRCDRCNLPHPASHIHIEVKNEEVSDGKGD